jgi:hypothetical protein
MELPYIIRHYARTHLYVLRNIILNSWKRNHYHIIIIIQIIHRGTILGKAIWSD